MAVQVTKAPVYRALLIGETFRGTYNALPSKYDVSLLKKTLKSVKGPSGSAWKITDRLDRTADQIHSDIQAAFAGEQNVGVFQVVFEPGHIQDHVDAGQKLCVKVGKECVAEPAGCAGAGGLSER